MGIRGGKGGVGLVQQGLRDVGDDVFLGGNALIPDAYILNKRLSQLKHFSVMVQKGIGLDLPVLCVQLSVPLRQHHSRFAQSQKMVLVELVFWLPTQPVA